MDGGQEAGHHWEQEAGFLMRDRGQEHQTGDCAEEGKAWWGEDCGNGWDENEGGAEKEGK